MDTAQRFSCFLIGEGTLLIQCAEILVKQGQTIFGIISSDPRVHRWAQERKISSIDPKNGDIVPFLSQRPFDYLLSIVNPLVLSKQVLELPRCGAINYHDAPLPKYAGSYATSWAIIQGEKEYGITWHAMTDRIDAGEIFKQRFFEIDVHETAFSLNTKCYDAALSAFAELVDEISSGKVAGRRQNLDERSFYPLYKRPFSGCVLFWSSSNREICALVRALNFGPYDNPLGLAKITVGMDFVIVLDIEEVNSLSSAPPGTIISIDPNFVRIATGDGDVLLRKLLTIDGQPLFLADFVEMFGLHEGYRFKELDQEVATRITTYNASVCRYELFWKKYLETLKRVELPYIQRYTLAPHTEQYIQRSLPISQEMINHLVEYHETWPVEDFLLSAFVAYMARLGEVWSFDLGYRDADLKLELADLGSMFLEYAFIHVDIESNQTFEEIVHTVGEQVKQTKIRKTYARDIIARFPNLNWETKLQGAYQPSIFVEQVASLDDYQIPQGVDLALIVLKGGQQCLWVYNTQVLSEGSVEKMQHEFTVFLQACIADTQAPVSQLSLLTERDRHLLLDEWNATGADYPQNRCVHELFEEQVQRTPEAVAVVFEGAQLTYQELNWRANQLAHYLQQRGVGPDVLVGLCVEQSLEMIVGLLGILKARGAYLPLDPSSPTDRLAFMLQDSQAALLLTQKSLLDQLGVLHPQVVCLDADLQAISLQSTANTESLGTNQHLAYVIYTSGSTGRPKGVLIEHRSFTAHCWSIIQEYEFSATDSFLQFSPFTFDASLEQIIPALMVGARLMMRGKEMWSPTELLDKIKTLHLTFISFSVSYWQQVLQEWVRSPKELECLSLRLVLVGGERLLPEVVQLWRQSPLRSARLINAYGPTETTIAATFYDVPCSQGHVQEWESVPIGRPLPNRTVYILDSMRNPVPIGIAGELYVGGIGVARGYLNRPDLTAERFIADPFSKVPEVRLYRTGDIARYQEDGNIEFLGRVDDQVKIRGYRIEPGEIEAVLNRHPVVRQSVVVAREDIPGDKYLLAYLVLHEQESVKIDELKTYMAKLVPLYMVPSAFVVLEALPLTTHGKVDRRALPAPDLSSYAVKETFIAPQHMLHFQLTTMWEELLNVHPIGIRDNFFDLGGHSLLAVRLLTSIEQVFHQKLQLNTLFANPTIERLADVLQTKVGNDLQMPIIAIQAGGENRPFFFLHGQWHGDAFFCYPLAKELGKNQPFYAIPPYPLSTISVLPGLEEIATSHIQALQSVQPHGPYRLGGWCNGALLAYEMARQLHAQGQAVDTLILINPSELIPQGHFMSVYKLIVKMGRLLHLSSEKQLNCFLRLNHLNNYLLHATTYRNTVEVEQLRTAIQTRWAKWGKRVGAFLSLLELLFPSVELLRTYPSNFSWITASYTPSGVYSGKISFFWHRDEPPNPAAWQHVIEATGAEEYYLPGTHATILTDHLSEVAKQIRFCLGEVNDFQLAILNINK